MSRLIDAEDYLYRERPVGLSDELYEESHLYKSIMEQEVVQAIPLAEVKQAREEIQSQSFMAEIYTPKGAKRELVVSFADVEKYLDKLIAESEG